MSEEKNSAVATVVAAFAVGTIVGATLAVLYAPASGRETRELLAKKTKDIKDKVEESFDEAKEMISEKRAELVAAVQAGKKAMCDKAKEADKA